MQTVQILDEVGKLLSELAVRTHKSENFYATDALLQLLEDAEDYHLAAESRKNKGPGMTLEELEKRLDISPDE